MKDLVIFAPLAIQFHVQVFTGDTVNIQMEELVLLETPSTSFSLDSTDEHLQNSLVYRASSNSLAHWKLGLGCRESYMYMCMAQLPGGERNWSIA